MPEESHGQRSLAGYSPGCHKRAGLVTSGACSHVTGGVPSLGVTSTVGTGKSLNHPGRRKILLRAEPFLKPVQCLSPSSSTVDPRSLRCFQPTLRTSGTPLPPGSPPTLRPPLQVPGVPASFRATSGRTQLAPGAGEVFPQIITVVLAMSPTAAGS